jgi:hypothetical protein
MQQLDTFHNPSAVYQVHKYYLKHSYCLEFGVRDCHNEIRPHLVLSVSNKRLGMFNSQAKVKNIKEPGSKF